MSVELSEQSLPLGLTSRYCYFDPCPTIFGSTLNSTNKKPVTRRPHRASPTDDRTTLPKFPQLDLDQNHRQEARIGGRFWRESYNENEVVPFRYRLQNTSKKDGPSLNRHSKLQQSFGQGQFATSSRSHVSNLPMVQQRRRFMHTQQNKPKVTESGGNREQLTSPTGALYGRTIMRGMVRTPKKIPFSSLDRGPDMTPPPVRRCKSPVDVRNLVRSPECDAGLELSLHDLTNSLPLPSISSENRKDTKHQQAGDSNASFISKFKLHKAAVKPRPLPGKRSTLVKKPRGSLPRSSASSGDSEKESVAASDEDRCSGDQRRRISHQASSDEEDQTTSSFSHQGSSSQFSSCLARSLKAMTVGHRKRLFDSGERFDFTGNKLWVDCLSSDNNVVDSNGYEMFARKPLPKTCSTKLTLLSTRVDDKSLAGSSRRRAGDVRGDGDAWYTTDIEVANLTGVDFDEYEDVALWKSD